MEPLNLIDIVIIGVLLVSLVFGYIRGFVKKLVSIIGWFICYLAAYWFYDDVSPIIQSRFPVSSYDKLSTYSGIVEGLKLEAYIYNSLAFALLFFGGRIVITAAGFFLQGVVSIPGISFFNRWGGVLLALIESIVIIIIGVTVLQAIPSERIIELMEDSYIVNWLNTSAIHSLITHLTKIV